MTMIFLPLPAGDLQRLLATGELSDVVGFTATTTLRREHGFGPTEDEDADYAAFTYACVQAITSARLPDATDGARDEGPSRAGRIVVAADVAAADADDRTADPFGRTAVARVRRRDVTAVYLDEASAWPALAEAQQTAEGQDLDRLMDAPVVESLLDEHAMLWHLPTEVAD